MKHDLKFLMHTGHIRVKTLSFGVFLRMPQLETPHASA
ncbi:hypothetical protein APS_0992 [Acetobacter pasteurianus subsp. pasteurianus LMG 1262 = NBRC 106471]|nr:hypothetical protein APS_0992 [Acetobacter pasteurianus subsp. pasteurianus LMG 1262 = NBRC 106471]